MPTDRLITHAGPFHADDVFASVVLSGLWPEATLVRTRDDEVLRAGIEEPGSVVFDVGGAFDPAKRVYDHHQRGFERAREGVPYAAFGLVWEAHGRAWLEQACGAAAAELDPAWLELELRVVRAIDAVDNGVPLGREEGPQPLDVSQVVHAMNPVDASGPAPFDAAFLRAVEWARGVLSTFAGATLAALRAVEAVRACDDGGPVLELPRALPWQGAVSLHHLFVMFPDASTQGHWLVQCVSDPEDRFTPLQPFPEAWRGLRDGELAAVCGVGDATFCHRAGFIAGARTIEGARALAREALADRVPIA